MCRVNSFLFCIKLESFGLFIGWLEYVMSVFVAVGSVIGTSFILRDAFAVVSFVKGLTALVTLLIVLVLCLFVANMSKELIKGIKTRDPEGVKVFRNLCVFNVASAILVGVFLLLWETEEQAKNLKSLFLMTSLYNFLLQTYVLVCIHSLCLQMDEQRYPSLIRHDSNTFHSEFDDDADS